MALGQTSKLPHSCVVGRAAMATPGRLAPTLFAVGSHAARKTKQLGSRSIPVRTVTADRMIPVLARSRTRCGDPHT
jgi:hypothetical protein